MPLNQVTYDAMLACMVVYGCVWLCINHYRLRFPLLLGSVGGLAVGSLCPSHVSFGHPLPHILRSFTRLLTSSGHSSSSQILRWHSSTFRPSIHTHILRSSTHICRSFIHSSTSSIIRSFIHISSTSQVIHTLHSSILYVSPFLQCPSTCLRLILHIFFLPLSRYRSSSCRYQVFIFTVLRYCSWFFHIPSDHMCSHNSVDLSTE